MKRGKSVWKGAAVRLLICCLVLAMCDAGSLPGISVSQAVGGPAGPANEGAVVLNGFEEPGVWATSNSPAGELTVTQITYPRTEGQYASQATYRMNAGVRSWVNYTWNTGGQLDLSSMGKMLIDVYPITQTNGPREPLSLKIADAAGIVYERQLPKMKAGEWNTVELDLTELPTAKNKITMINFYSFGGFDFEGRAEVTYIFDHIRVQPLQNMTKPVQAAPGAGTVVSGTAVQLSSPTAGATLYYTLDGTDPRSSATRIIYSQPISLERESTIKAYAAKAGLFDSFVSTFHYDVITGIVGESLLDLDSYISKMGGGKLLPLLAADHISIDGDLDDWAGQAGIELPADAKRQVQMSDWKGESDLSGKIKYAYDEDYFYMAAKVTDNTHKAFAGDMMWKGDSLQLAFSADGIAYGPEYGLALVGGEPQTAQWSAGTGTLGREAIELQAVRYGNETIYEARLPWEAIFAGGMPPQFYFSMLINDNDGGERKGYIEWTGGIGRFKDPTQFALLKPVGPDEKWDMWIIAGVEPNDYTVSIPNYSDEPLTVDLAVPLLQIQGTITVPPKTVLRKQLTVGQLSPGKHMLEAVAAEQGSGIQLSRTETINVLADAAALKVRFDAIAARLPQLEQLLKDAETSDLATDYENVNYTVIKNFLTYGRQDIAQGYLERAQYVAEELEKLHAEAESRLQAYLNGTASPWELPRYVTGESIEINDYSFLADTIAPGEAVAKKRPVFFTGYGHFGQVRADIPQFKGYGTNTIQMEIGLSSVIKEPGSLRGWSINKAGAVNASAVIDHSVYKSGNGSIRITNASPQAPQVYLNVMQNVAVKPNTTYVIKAWVKGEQVSNVWFPGGANWAVRKKFPEGSYDWTEQQMSYTTGENETRFPFLIVSEGISGKVWVDDVSMTEEGSSENLLENSGFEQVYASEPGKEYAISTETIEKDILKELQKAANNNIAVNLLISPHYFPEWAFAKWPEARFADNSQFIKYNIDHPQAREMLEQYLRTLIPLVKDAPALHSITISNEPVYETNKQTVYLLAWQQYLSSLYDDIGKLNQVYGTAYSAFADVPMPSGIQATPHFYDWVLFNNTVFGDWHKWMADIIKEQAPDIPLHSKTMNGGFLRGALVWGVDPERFTEFSQINGDDNVSYLDMGMPGLLNELRFYDLQSSLKKAPIFNSEDHLIADRDNRYVPEQVTHVRSVLWQGAVHGRSASTIWVWERSYDTKSYFYGSILHRPDVTAAVGRTSLDLNRLAEEVTALQQAKANTAILYSLPSMVYAADYPDVVSKAYEAASLSGQKVGFVTEKQAAEGQLLKYKVIILAGVTHVKAETAQALKAFVEAGGSLFVIGEGEQTLKYSEHNQMLSAAVRDAVLQHPGTTTISKSLSTAQIRAALLQLLDQRQLNKVMLIDAESGQPVQGVEWRSAEHKGKLLINIGNYNGDPKRVYMKYKGNTISRWTDLLNDEVSNTSLIELASMQPRLISIKQ
ncbi:chitobiase/beta-hexosaminidase C-terminal domain-containing protein [Paenibacillus sp. GCM10027626]|uniref:chitobiase/beta-hexosaminidase C-terminal domain-containing protein n=1 Tax=Paenibacillus sp. GCM10027626 TaxID=3273411 RepID=UPI0036362775